MLDHLFINLSESKKNPELDELLSLDYSLITFILVVLVVEERKSFLKVES